MGLVLLVLIYLVSAYVMAWTVIHLNRQPVPKTPWDYGMGFDDLEFQAEDGVRLKGWLIPGTQQKLVVLTHVGGLTKYGSTVQYKNISKLYNKEVEFIRTAQHLHEQGYWVLMFDFRNHGESGPDPDRGLAGVGLKEYKDVVAAMKFVHNDPRTKNMAKAFVSFCMGANSTIIAMSKEPEAFKDVKCLMAIQPISMEVFVRSYLKSLLTPVGVWLFLPLVKKFVVLQGGAPIETMSPKEYAKDLKVPTLYVQAVNDPWTELSDIQSFYDNTPATKEFFWIKDTKHRFESYSYFQDRPEKMLEWLAKWL